MARNTTRMLPRSTSTPEACASLRSNRQKKVNFTCSKLTALREYFKNINVWNNLCSQVDKVHMVFICGICPIQSQCIKHPFSVKNILLNIQCLVKGD